MNSNDKITIDVKKIQPFKEISFKDNPSTNFLVIFVIIISTTFILTFSILTITWIVEVVKNK